ncbi:MAG: hypothetical protein JSS25_05125 [Proteobacteria bacterium]|nr:hypothetical protein [Pseudomonadota bacterium]
MKTKSSIHLPLRANQSGAALIVVLLLLIIITLLGLAAMRGAIMQERMAANTTGRSAAFQAAEAGLRQAERAVHDSNYTTPFADGCSNGLCSMPYGATSPVDNGKASVFFTGSNGYRTGTPVQTSFGSITPKYIIEDFGQANGSNSQPVDQLKASPPSLIQNVFRITSYASTPSGVEVILQSQYRR